MNRDDNSRPGSGRGNRPGRPPHGNGDKQRPPHDSGKPRPPHDGGKDKPHPPHGGGDYPPSYPKQHDEKNKHFMRAIMNDYSGQDVSEMGAVLLYIYESITLEPRDKQLARELLRISEDEMRHFHILGKMIVSLGGDPEYRSEQPGSYFNAGNMTYPKTLKDMLQINIQSETAAIQNYYQRVRIAPTPEIAENIQKIIEDERKHLDFFKKQYQRLLVR